MSWPRKRRESSPDTGWYVVWEGAKDSTAQPGRPGPFERQVSDPALLDGPDYVRQTWYLYSSRARGAFPRIDEFHSDLANAIEARVLIRAGHSFSRFHDGL